MYIDDGWQTLNSDRGYGYVGDYNPERLPKLASLTAQLKDELDMGSVLWFAMPFVGRHTELYGKLKDKLLFWEEYYGDVHRECGAADPRFPEVRDLISDQRGHAMKAYGLVGEKLDFGDQFKRTEETEPNAVGGRDRASVDSAAMELFRQTKDRILEVNPDAVIEFRQKYIGQLSNRPGA